MKPTMFRNDNNNNNNTNLNSQWHYFKIILFLFSFIGSGLLFAVKQVTVPRKSPSSKMLLQQNTAEEQSHSSSSSSKKVHYEMIEDGTMNYYGSTTTFRKYIAVVRDGIQPEPQQLTVKEWAEYFEHDDFIISKSHEPEIEGNSKSDPSSTLLSSEERHSVTNNDVSLLTSSSFESSLHNQTISTVSSTNGAIQNFIKTLADTGYDAFFFETPPINQITFPTQLWEFVIVNAPNLQKKALRDGNDQFHVFEQECQRAMIQNNECCTFPNLSGDAILVVPKKSSTDHNEKFSHLAQFLRTASLSQIYNVFHMVAMTYRNELAASSPSNNKESYKWLSTSGLGVSWLHFRFDTYPKYYSYEPYKKPPSSTSTGAQHHEGVV